MLISCSREAHTIIPAKSMDHKSTDPNANRYATQHDRKEHHIERYQSRRLRRRIDEIRLHSRRRGAGRELTQKSIETRRVHTEQPGSLRPCKKPEGASSALDPTRKLRKYRKQLSKSTKGKKSKIAEKTEETVRQRCMCVAPNRRRSIAMPPELITCLILRIMWSKHTPPREPHPVLP